MGGPLLSRYQTERKTLGFSHGERSESLFGVGEGKPAPQAKTLDIDS
jgi:hypothetical protein